MAKNVKVSQLKEMVLDILRSVGLTSIEANIVYEHLLDGELAGHPSHGFLRIPKIVNDLKKQQLHDIVVENDLQVSALINGGYKTGLVVANKGMEIVLSKAKANGVGIVGGYNNTGTLGALGYYTKQIADHGFIGFMVVASEYAISPWGGKDSVLGTNPISFSFPTKGESIVIDLATSVWTYGDLMIAMKENRKIPTGIVLDVDGNDSTDPNDADNGSQLPIGQHKGYALALAIEILGGLFVSAKAGFKAVPGTDGFMMMAWKPNLFVSLESYYKNIEDLILEIKGSSLRPGFKEILIPGELSSRRRKTNENVKFLNISEQIIQDIENLL